MALPPRSRIASTSDTAHATLIFTLEQIESVTPTRGSMTGVFDLTVPSEVSAAICDETGMAGVPDDQECSEQWSVTAKQSACVNNTPITRYILKPAYAAQVLTLSIDPISHDPALTTTQALFTTTIPAKEIFLPPLPFAGVGCVSTNYPIGDSTHIHFTTPVTLPLVSQGATYPSDWYQSTFEVVVSLPPGWYIPNMLVGSGLLGYLPTDMHVALDTSTSHYMASVGQATLSLVYPNIVFGSNLLLLQVNRTANSQWFDYSTAVCIPLILILILGHGLWKRKERDSLFNVLLNVLIAIITVAAIRQILVPPDLQGLLTRLDLLLGTEGMILLAIVCSTYAWKIIKSDQQEEGKSIATT